MTPDDDRRPPDPSPAAKPPDEPLGERHGPQWPLGSTLGWTAWMAVTYFFAQLVGVMLAGGAEVLRGTPGATGGGGSGGGSGAELEAFTGTMLAAATIVAALVCVPMIVWILRAKPQPDLRRDLALRPVSRETWWRWLGAAVLFALLSDALSMLFGRPIVDPSMKAIYQSAQPAWLLVAAIVVAAPIVEEVFFRGFLYRGIAMTRAATIGAIVITSALWSWLHVQYDAYGVANVFVMGLLLGAARRRTGSLLVPVGMHMLNNAIATVELVASV